MYQYQERLKTSPVTDKALKSISQQKSDYATSVSKKVKLQKVHGSVLRDIHQTNKTAMIP